MYFDPGNSEGLFHYFNENSYTPQTNDFQPGNLYRENINDPLSLNPYPNLLYDPLQVYDDMDNVVKSEDDHHLRPLFLSTDSHDSILIGEGFEMGEFVETAKGLSSCLIVYDGEGGGNRETTNGGKKNASKRKRVFDSKSKIFKGQWSPEEDKSLIKLVEKYGRSKWSSIAQMLSRRNGRQCRERWHNHLNPIIKKDRWSEDEDKILINAHKQLGNKWSEIERIMPWRSENTIKNHWNATKRRQLPSSKRKKYKNSNSNANSLLQNYIASLTISDRGCSENSSVTGVASMPFYYKQVKGMKMIK